MGGRFLHMDVSIYLVCNYIYILIIIIIIAIIINNNNDNHNQTHNLVILMIIIGCNRYTRPMGPKWSKRQTLTAKTWRNLHDQSNIKVAFIHCRKKHQQKRICKKHACILILYV